MSKNPYLERREIKGIDHGGKAEKKFAKRVGADLHAASGAKTKKADMTAGKFKVECKSTKNDSISVKLEYLLKVYQEAFETGERPALSIQFVVGNGQARKRASWVMITEEDFQKLVDMREEED